MHLSSEILLDCVGPALVVETEGHVHTRHDAQEGAHGVAPNGAHLRHLLDVVGCECHAGGLEEVSHHRDLVLREDGGREGRGRGRGM